MNTRLLSPTSRRIYPNARSSNQGAGDTETMQFLHDMLGWMPYSGPAMTDKNGYVVATTDPYLHPQPPLINPNSETRHPDDRRPQH